MNLRTSIGEIKVKNSNTNKLKINTTTGSIYIDLNNNPETIELSTTIGEIIINNLDLNQYKIRINTSIGDIKTPYGNFEKQFEYGNGQKTIE
ncbi:DUF4097 family beta strand repeat-containing protein, partial [Streptomyces caniscabiei]|uniref:DUF4097 family beta strand repeat-containing protein n=1 Tax=Streptomyces caniscabiei TaxID=2746961 RepID=UPI0038F7B3CE